MGALKSFVAIELADDIKKLVKFNEDVDIIQSLKDKLDKFDDDDMVKITKEIGSLKITDLELVNEELLEREL